MGNFLSPTLVKPISTSEHKCDAAYTFCTWRKPQFITRSEQQEITQQERVPDRVANRVHDPGRQHRFCCQPDFTVNNALAYRSQQQKRYEVPQLFRR